MKALVLTDVSKLEIKEVETPQPKAGEVQINIKAVAICNSDVHGYDGSSGRRKPTLIMGHEASGVISAVGEGVTKFKVGDRVVFNSVRYCGECWYCRHGLENMCTNGCCYGIQTDEIKLDGAMAEYLCVPEYIVYKMPDNISFEQAAMLEPLAICVHAIGGFDIKINDTVVVMGAGVMGLMCIRALKATGAGKVISVEVDESRKEMARKSGADYVIDGREDVPAQIKALTDGVGADYAIETASLKKTILTAFQSVRRDGTIVQLGNIAPFVEAPLQLLVNNEMKWIGRYGSFTEYAGAMHLVSSGKVSIDDCLSKVAPLEEGQYWFDRLHEGDPTLMKVVLKP